MTDQQSKSYKSWSFLFWSTYLEYESLTKVVIYSGVKNLKIFLAENFDNETLFKSVIMALMLEFGVNADRFQDILEKLKQQNFTFDKHHFVVDKYRVELGQ